MIIYRPHRGNLFDSMEEAKEFQNEHEMKEFIVEQYNNLFYEGILYIEDIVIDNTIIMNDERIGWQDTRYVCTKRMGLEDYMQEYGCPQCIGMCATYYK